ncbi:MAG TPA: type II secretion system protein [Gammaproteobacteria bacterium]|jgi:prepilin-type N-terminal cleavage/methylation domain-containing protein|nr:type II secretion system protein [Gammaproteobacteria bacterium]
MKMINRYMQKGFTLVEMMLVAAIISGFIFLGISYTQQRTRALMIDRASAQMQQILNAGLSYYINNGNWPADIATLKTGTYLPATVVSPWGTSYSVSNNSTVFTVTLTLPSTLKGVSGIAQIVAGKLPFGVATTSSPYTVTSSVNIPAQSLNNVGNLSYAGVYHNGGCVPVPQCPNTDATGSSVVPEIQVAPVSFSGFYDAGSTTGYPLTSITASTSGNYVDLSLGSGPAACGNSTSTTTDCYSDATVESPVVYSVPGPNRGSVKITTGKYWRVCLYVTTQAGSVTWDSLTGQYTAILAMTRCKSTNETSGSTMNVWAY